MAKSSSNSNRTSSSSSRSSHRPAPLVPKAGMTHSGRRTYGCGGKVSK